MELACGVQCDLVDSRLGVDLLVPGELDSPTSVLVNGIQFDAQTREGFTGDAVAVHRGDDIRSGLVNCAVDDISRRVDRVHVSAGLNDSRLVYETQILGSHVLEGLAVRVDPEVVWHDGVPDRYVPTGTFVVVSVGAEPSEGRGVM